MGLFYVCDECFVWEASLFCEDERDELRVAPNGKWLCDAHWVEDLLGEWDKAPIPPSLSEFVRLHRRGGGDDQDH